MKKTLIMLTGLLISTQANANPYVGLNYNQSKIDYKKNDVVLSNDFILKDVDRNDVLNRKSKEFDMFGGYIFDNNLFIEGVYTNKFKQNREISNTNLYWVDTYNEISVKTETKINTFDLNGGYNYNIKKFNIFASGGCSYVYYHTFAEFQDEGTTRLTANETEQGFGLNSKIGIEYQINDNIALRTNIKYTKAFMKNIDNMITYGIGIKFTD